MKEENKKEENVIYKEVVCTVSPNATVFVGKTYKVLDKNNFNEYLIKDDNGDSRWCNNAYFDDIIKKVVCKKSTGLITKEKIYGVISASDNSYRIIDDGGQEWWYTRDYFIDLEELVPDSMGKKGGSNMKEENKREEMVCHPSHYTQHTYEPIDVIEDWDLGFSLGNAVKYIARAGYKWDAIEDLKKAVFYIEYAIKMMEKEKEEKEEQ